MSSLGNGTIELSIAISKRHQPVAAPVERLQIPGDQLAEQFVHRKGRRNKKGRSNGFEPARIVAAVGDSDLRLGFPQADDALALFPLAAFPEQLDALEALRTLRFTAMPLADCRLLCWDMT